MVSKEEREAAAALIDPRTAEVDWTYAQVVDPYGEQPEIPPEYWCVNREYFARSPGSDVWVWFGDLPKNICDELSKRRHESPGQRLSDLLRLIQEAAHEIDRLIAAERW